MTEQNHIQDSVECTACHILKSASEFQKRKNRPKGISSWCKQCSNKYTSKFWKENPEKKRIKDKNWKSHNKEKLTEYWSKRDKKLHDLILPFKDNPCADCGIKYHPCAMDFDHLDPTVKVASISQLSRWRNKTKELLEEIKKCELVCAVCHRIRTYNRGLSSRLKKTNGEGDQSKEDNESCPEKHSQP